jgi:transaldolase
MTLHVLEKLAATNPECEIWWDSSPLVYSAWQKGVLGAAPPEKAPLWEAQLGRLFDPEATGGAAHRGFRGVTTNPPLSLQAIQGDPDYWVDAIRQLMAEDPEAGVEEIYWRTYLRIVRHGAEMVRPLFEATGGKYGFLSGQVDPRFTSDRGRMLAQGLEIAAIGPNVMVKIPGSREGYEVIEELTARGISTNNTTSFSVPQYLACMNAVSRGLERARAQGIDISRWRSVITHMSARLGNIGDLKAQAETRAIELTPEEILWGELAVIKRAYRHAREIGHPSKMLMCSMRVVKERPDGAAASWHIEKLAGGEFVYTCPPGYISELMAVEDRLAPFDPQAVNEDPPPGVLDKLLQLPYFRQAYEFDGMAPEDFARFGAFVATAAEFSAATRRTIDFVSRVFEDTQHRAA